MIWRPKGSVAAAGSTETAKVTWSLPQRTLCVTKKMQNLAQLPFLQGDEEKPSGSTALVGTVSLLLAGVWWGRALLSWECVGSRAMGYKSQRLQAPSPHFGRGA